MITACAKCFFLQQAELHPAPNNAINVCRPDAVSDRQIARFTTVNQELQRVRAWLGKAYAHFQEFIAACRLLLCEVACRLLTAWPARRSADVDVTCQSLPRPSSSSFRSAKPAVDRFDRRPDRGYRFWRGVGDFRAAPLRTMIDEPIRSDHRCAMVVVELR